MVQTAAMPDVGSFFEVEFVGGDGRVRRGPLAEHWAAGFEEVLPVRAFRWARGQGHFPGWYWSATSGRHVGHESWLERDHAMLMDFDHRVVGFSSQPFRLWWRDSSGLRRHTPDYFARLDDGVGVVVDVRDVDRIEPRDAQAFAATGRACESVGWVFRRVGAVDPVLVANVRWLSRYRHPRCFREQVAARLLKVFAEPGPLRLRAGAAGDVLATLPVLYHLMWSGLLVADLSVELLHSESMVVRGGQGPW